MNTTPAALGQVKSNHRPFADDLTGRVVIVTGGASGMGAATVHLLVGAGAHVLIVDRNVTLAESLAAELGQSAHIGDVSDSSFCNGVVEAALRQHGRLDGLVNAAGIIVRAAGHATSDEDWHRIMGVNVSGTFFMCRAALQAMQQVRSGAIVNFGSIWGDLGSAGVAAYCASKGAVHNLTRGLALDHAGDGIRVNAVCPGEVRTPMLQSERSEPVTQELLDRLATTVPMGRLAEPEEIARVVVFLLSDSASYMTGTLVTVDAGFAAR
jgi:meso-butanediol dehydrogenase / (S,S)-butanediol dehydrogenase / diacetyl reductase